MADEDEDATLFTVQDVRACRHLLGRVFIFSGVEEVDFYDKEFRLPGEAGYDAASIGWPAIWN